MQLAREIRLSVSHRLDFDEGDAARSITGVALPVDGASIAVEAEIDGCFRWNAGGLAR
jgi:hypothetical protein